MSGCALLIAFSLFAAKLTNGKLSVANRAEVRCEYDLRCNNAGGKNSHGIHLICPLGGRGYKFRKSLHRVLHLISA